MSSLTRIAALVVAGVVAGVAMAGPAAAANDAYALGDSVMLGARWALQRQGIDVDAQKNRQARSAADLLRQRAARLPTHVVVHLGTNGTMPDDACRSILRAVGPERHVYLVSIKARRSWVPGNNRRIRACAAAHPGQVSVIDWAWAAGRHRNWLYADGIHLRPDGAKAYARIIANAVSAASADAAGR